MRSGAALRAAVMRWGLLPAAVALGLAAERSANGFAEPRLWAADLAVGLVLAACGVHSWPRHRPVAVLLGLCASGWFVGTAWSSAAFWHVGPLVHVLVTAPRWRPRTRLELAAVAGGYVVAVGMPGWQSDAVSVGAATGLLAVLLALRRAAAGPELRQRQVALRLGAVFAVAALAGAALRSTVATVGAAELSLLLHEVAVCAVAVGLVVSARRPAATAVADLVVELGEATSGRLPAALARALGDPDLRVGHAAADGTYLDAHGRPVAVPIDAGQQTATFVERDGRPYAVLVHDAAVPNEPAVVEAVASAIRLADSNAALRVQVGARMVEIDASRRRLLVTADEERARLAQRLRDGAGRRLELLHAELSAAAPHSADGCIVRVLQQLSQCRSDLSALAQGLRPRELDDGLAGALNALAARCPLPLVVITPDERYDVEVETTAWFVCAEAVANAVKHSAADQARVTIFRKGGTLVVVVQDDGVGGANPSAGTGVRGLIDRVDAQHGHVRVESPPAGGTRVTIELPLEGVPR